VSDSKPLDIVVVGASGDLAHKKVYPALFALYSQGLLPEKFHVYGFARSEFDESAFRERIESNLTCRYVPESSCASQMEAFLERCSYMSGQYDDPESFKALKASMADRHDKAANRLFYLAIPPKVFSDAVRSLGEAGLADEAETNGHWSRVVIEKPFGRDRASSDALSRDIAAVFDEDQTYRIDHYLGKEVVQNLMVLRFANLIFEPVWNNLYISRVQLSWLEDLDVGGRGGYFDHYGIIRDVMQNHLLQILSLLTMESPLDLGQQVRNEKVKVLSAIDPVRMDELVVGQYTANTYKGREQCGYLEEDKVAPDSITPTYAASVLHIRNRRWEGVPFLLRAAKGMDRKLTEIHVQFRHVPGNVFCPMRNNCLPPNELVIRVQPDEAIFIRFINKVPGLGMKIDTGELDLTYAKAYDHIIPDAYESLILDVIKGERGLFIREDELAASWDIFTPVLHQLEEERVQPEPYPFGTKGPEKADTLADRYRARWR
jgi:glucose-6-phosphate 1-dehydrogenase